MAHSIRFNAPASPSVDSALPSGAGPAHLRADGVTRVLGGRRVLNEVDLVVSPGERIGLIGENGAGKSTLLRVLAGLDVPDAGTVRRPASLGHLAQELPFPPGATLDEVLERSLAPVRAIGRELEAAAAALAEADGAGGGSVRSVRSQRFERDERYERALGRAEESGLWSIDSRRDAVLAGLGLAGIPRGRRLGEVSGGQRSRVALAALLVAEPAALLLDEPTNHLDDDATAFLRDRLRAWRGPVLFASHDRAFLDEVATGVADMDPGAERAVRRFGGGFSDYLAEKAAERARWWSRYEAEQEELDRLRTAVAVTSRRVTHDRPPRDNEKLGYDATGERVQSQISRRIRNARGRLDELLGSQVAKPPLPLDFTGIPHGSHALPEEAGALLALEGGWVRGRMGSAERPVTVTVGPRSRILVTGPNGAGKSTLLGLLAGAGSGEGARASADARAGADARDGSGSIALSGGELRRRRGLRVGLLTQDVVLEDPALPTAELYRRSVGEVAAERVPLASLGLLAARDLGRPAGELSVGQQRRLALALIVARPPDVFLLDEPTNHLSLALAGELEDAFGGYPGAVVVASHDRWLRRRWKGTVLAL